MKSILIHFSTMWQAADGACIKLQNFNSSKGDLEGAYLNGINGGVGDLNYLSPAENFEGFLTEKETKHVKDYTITVQVPYVDKNSPYNWMIRE